MRLLLVQPPDHVGHRGSHHRCGKQQRSQELLRVRIPEPGVVHPPFSQPWRPSTGPRRCVALPTRCRPWRGETTRRPRFVGQKAHRARRVVVLDRTERPAPSGRRQQEVRLDTRRQQGPGPFEDGRDREPGRLAGLRRPHNHDRVPGLSRQQSAGVGPEHDPVAA